MMTTPRRMSLPSSLATKEGQRIQVPEGGELVCYRTEGDRLILKVEYSREMMVKLSASIFCHQRPLRLAVIADEMPELLGCPNPIPACGTLPDQEPPAEPSDHLPSFRLFTPLRGPVTSANEEMRTLSSQRELEKRLMDFSMSSPSGGYPWGGFETPMQARGDLRNPRFTMDSINTDI
ncbi:unnamed protein product [Caenorhabditis sp. 36 PRJEB53466]|nr:unnamed protein product [Caenorhabditis sp. 36 PRJEB53466]